MLPGFGNWGFFHNWEGKLESLFWTKGCCGIGVLRDLWSLYSGQSRKRIGFPGCFALTLCFPSTAGKRPHLPDTHTHTHAESDNRKQDSAMVLKSWGFKEKDISCSFFPLFHLHFTSIKEEGEGGTKWPLRGSGSYYPHHSDADMGRETAFEGEKESWCVRGTVQKPACLVLSLAIWLWICENWHQKRLIRDSLHKHKLQRAHKSSGTHKITQEMGLSIESDTIKH